LTTTRVEGGAGDARGPGQPGRCRGRGHGARAGSQPVHAAGATCGHAGRLVMRLDQLCNLMHDAVYRRLLPFQWLPDPSPEGVLLPAEQIGALRVTLGRLFEAAGAVLASNQPDIALHGFVSSGHTAGGGSQS